MGLFSRWLRSNKSRVVGVTKRLASSAAGGLLNRFTKYAQTDLPLHALPADVRRIAEEAIQILPSAAGSIAGSLAGHAVDRVDQAFD
jgi:hypothetical protein